MPLIKNPKFIQYMNQAEKTLNEKTLRERLLVLFTVLFATFFLWKNIFFSYLSQSTEEIAASKEQLASQISRLEGQIGALSEIIGHDTTASLQKKLEDIIAKNLSLHNEIKVKAAHLIESKDMQEILASLLKSYPHIHLVQIKSIPDKPLFEKDSTVQVYQKGIVVELQGDFLDTLSFLRQLEMTQTKLFWDNLSYKVSTYPLATVKITMHTTGQEGGWLGV